MVLGGQVELQPAGDLKTGMEREDSAPELPSEGRVGTCELRLQCCASRSKGKGRPPRLHLTGLLPGVGAQPAQIQGTP
jgi:hypothetical protein